MIRTEQQFMTENRTTPVLNSVGISFDDEDDDEELTEEEYAILLVVCAVPRLPLQPAEPENLSQSSCQPAECHICDRECH